MSDFLTPLLEEFGVTPENPFVAKLQLPIRARYKNVKKEKYTDHVGKEHERRIADVSKYDPESFIKFFESAFGRLATLELKAIRLMFYICHQLHCDRHGKDQVYLVYPEVKKWMNEKGIGFSKTTFDRAKTELIEADLIVTKESPYGCRTFFINPAVIFNGNRREYLKKIIAKSLKEKVAESSQQMELPLGENGGRP